MFKKLNTKSKKLASKFFIETKLGIWLMASMAVLNAIEGVVHLIVAIIGSWGVVSVNVYDVRVLLPIIENFILGIFSLLTGWALGIKHDHHHVGHKHD